VTLIDTAPIYGQGRSEDIVGRALERFGSRDRVVVATKAGRQWTRNGEVIRNSSRERILKEIDDSLARLRRAVGRADELRTRMREQGSAQVPSARSAPPLSAPGASRGDRGEVRLRRFVSGAFGGKTCRDGGVARPEA
jgi:Aldo/keto reductase family